MESNTTDKQNNIKIAKCHNSAFCTRSDETVTYSDNAVGRECKHDHSKHVYTESGPCNTSFSFAVSNTPLSNTSIRDDT